MTDGTDLLGRIAQAGARMEPGLGDADVERMVRGGRQRRRRRVLRRAALFMAISSVGAGVFVAWAVRDRPRTEGVMALPAPTAGTQAPEASQVLQLHDGSKVTRLDAATQIVVATQSEARVELALVKGSGRFQVSPRPERAFNVRVGDVTVSALGTVFTVERVADRVGVTVEHGRVRVDWGIGSRLLGQGDSGWFPPLVVSPPPSPPRVEPGRSKMVAAQKMTKQPQPEDEGAKGLLLAADSARLAGDPERGVALLESLLRQHPADPRAPLAAFSLGRLLMMELGRPRQAAAAFAEARRLSPEGPFAEDALAREVEAWHRVGQGDEARRLAREYLRLYPGGRRVSTVRAMGGME